MSDNVSRFFEVHGPIRLEGNYLVDMFIEYSKQFPDIRELVSYADYVNRFVCGLVGDRCGDNLADNTACMMNDEEVESVWRFCEFFMDNYADEAEDVMSEVFDTGIPKMFFLVFFTPENRQKLVEDISRLVEEFKSLTEGEREEAMEMFSLLLSIGAKSKRNLLFFLNEEVMFDIPVPGYDFNNGNMFDNNKYTVDEFVFQTLRLYFGQVVKHRGAALVLVPREDGSVTVFGVKVLPDGKWVSMGSDEIWDTYMPDSEALSNEGLEPERIKILELDRKEVDELMKEALSQLND